MKASPYAGTDHILANHWLRHLDHKTSRNAERGMSSAGRVDSEIPVLNAPQPNGLERLYGRSREPGPDPSEISA